MLAFIDRVDGYKKAITVIDEALAAVAANPISATFTANVPAGIDILNTLHALKARYSLFAGLYPQALAEANLVDLTKKSTFNFDALSLIHYLKYLRQLIMWCSQKIQHWVCLFHCSLIN